MTLQLTGVHHLTAVSASIRQNHHFYVGTLGMRLVKRSVNQDDPSAYHRFYADAVGSPGTDLTVFDCPVQREQRGTRSIVRTCLRVNGLSTLEWWQQHLRTHGVKAGDIALRDERATLDFEDPEGQRLSLVDDSGAGDSHPWQGSVVPAEHQVRGLGPIVMSVPTLSPTDAILMSALNMRPVRMYPHPENADDTVHVYEMGKGGPGSELHVAVQPKLPAARSGAGSVHHVAFRTPDNEYEAWADRLNTLGIANSGEVDRYWFRSLYFREPNGILFEIATDGPGFAVDEDPSTLGEKVVLAPFLEPHRAEIVAALKPID
jgi:glyoxalase family protein